MRSNSTNSKDSRTSSININLSATARTSTMRQCRSSSLNHSLNLNFNRIPNTFPTTTTRRR